MTQLPSHLPHESTVSSEDRNTPAPATAPQNAIVTSASAPLATANASNAVNKNTNFAPKATATNTASSTNITNSNQMPLKAPRITSNAVRDARKLVHFVPQDYAHGTVNNHRAIGDRVTWVNSKQVVNAVKTHHEKQINRNRKLIQEIAQRQGEISESTALKALYEHSLRQVATTRNASSLAASERGFNHSNNNYKNTLDKSNNAQLSRQSSYSKNNQSSNTSSDTANTLASGTILANSHSLGQEGASTSNGSALGRLTPQQQQLSAELADSQPSLLVPPLVNAEQHYKQSALQQSNAEQNARAPEQPNNIMKAQLRFLDEPSLPGFGIYQADTNQILLDHHAVRLLKFDQSLEQQWLSFYQVRRLLGMEITHQLLEHLRQLKDAYPRDDDLISTHDANEIAISARANAATTAKDYVAAITSKSPSASKTKTSAHASAFTNDSTSSVHTTLRQDLEDGVRLERKSYQEAHASYEKNSSLNPDSLKISSYPALFQFTLQPYGHMWYGVYREVLPNKRHAYHRDSTYEPYVHTKRIRHNHYRNVTYDINLTNIKHGIMFRIHTPLGPEEIWQRVELQERHDLIACHNALLTLLISKVSAPAIKYTTNLHADPQTKTNPNALNFAPKDIKASAQNNGTSLNHPNAENTVNALLTVPFMIKNLRLLANWYPVFTFALNPCTSHCESLSCNHVIQYAPYAYAGDNLTMIEPELRLGFKLGLDTKLSTIPQKQSSFNAAAAAVINANNTSFTTFNLDDSDNELNQHQHYFIPSNSDIDDIELSATDSDYRGLSRCTFAIYLPHENGQSEKLYIKLNAFFKDNGNINYISFTFTRIASKLFELMPHMVADSASLDWLLPTDECIYGRNYYTILGFKHNDPSIPYRHKLWLKTLVHPEDLATIHQDHKILQNARSGNVIESLYRTKCRDGSYIWTKGVATVLGRDRAGKGTRVLEVNIDINRVLEGYEQLQNKVFTDILTGLRNRTYLITHMEQFIRDYTGPLTVIFADITALKLYNDYLGHAIGDKLLCSAAILIKSAINRTNELIRISGDEIVCLLPNCSEQEANLVSQQIIAARQQYNKNAPIRMPVFFSIGCKTVNFSAYTGRDLHGEEKEEALAIFYEAIQTADQIMQENKKLAKQQHYSLVQAYIEKSLNQSISLQDNRLF